MERAWSFSNSLSVTFFLNLIVYILGTAFFMLLDYAKWPHFLYKYKMNPGANAPPDRKKVIKASMIELHID